MIPNYGVQALSSPHYLRHSIHCCHRIMPGRALGLKQWKQQKDQELEQLERYKEKRLLLEQEDRKPGKGKNNARNVCLEADTILLGLGCPPLLKGCMTSTRFGSSCEDRMPVMAAASSHYSVAVYCSASSSIELCGGSILVLNQITHFKRTSNTSTTFTHHLFV